MAKCITIAELTRALDWPLRHSRIAALRTRTEGTYAIDMRESQLTHEPIVKSSWILGGKKRVQEVVVYTERDLDSLIGWDESRVFEATKDGA